MVSVSAIVAVALAVAAALGAAVVLLLQARRQVRVLRDDLSVARRTCQTLMAAAVRDEATGLLTERGLPLLATPLLQLARRQTQPGYLIRVAVTGATVEQGPEPAVALLARLLQDCVRGTDVVARTRPDELCVVGAGSGISPEELERRLRFRLLAASAPQVAVVGDLEVTGSIIEPWDEVDVVEVLARVRRLERRP
ncbi:MAG: hypothetical protein ACTHMZ_12075 [Actinomycetes bacterium]